MDYFFTADYHLGHENIIKYCNRPFKSLKEMNKVIIRNHNQRVKKEDIIFHIGDFCFKNTLGGKKGEGVPITATSWENKLNGKIIHIQGNHDKNNSTKTIIESLVIKYGGKWIKLVHRPEMQFIESKYDLMLVGHIHNNWKFQRVRQGYSFIDLINVGVDVWNYMPVKFNEIMKEYYRWKKSYEYTSKSEK